MFTGELSKKVDDSQLTPTVPKTSSPQRECKDEAGELKNRHLHSNGNQTIPQLKASPVSLRFSLSCSSSSPTMNEKWRAGGAVKGSESLGEASSRGYLM